MIKRIFLYFLPLVVLFLLNFLNFPNYLFIFYLFLYFPFVLFLSFGIDYYDYLEKILLGNIIYFFVVAPIFYYLFYIFTIGLDFENVFIFISLLNIFLFLFSLIFNKNQTIVFSLKIKKVDWIFVLFFCFYIGLHQLFFYFYKFVPEWDGYGYLLNIEKMISSGYIFNSFRDLFNPSIVLLSLLTKIEPYKLFNFWMILLQSSLLLLVKLVIDRQKIDDLKKVLAYLLFFSFPVLNMEIDMVRPQNLFIISLPMVFYLIYRDFIKPNYTNWVFLFLISIVGTKYHEFFFFILLVFILFVLVKIFFYLKKVKDRRDLIIFGLIVLLGIFVTYSFLFKMQIFLFANNVFWGIFGAIKNPYNWRWWFLNFYNSDGANLQMGWSGLWGVTKYYAYYLSPIGIILLIDILYLFFYKKINIFMFYIFPFFLLSVFLFFADILPRLGYVYLPERFWLNISLVLIFLSLFLLEKLNKWFVYLLIFFSCIGIGGSVYVANQKKSLITTNEFEAVGWIKNNTEINSVFITQGGNGHMINYFAGRIAFSPSSDYFLSDKLIKYSDMMVSLNDDRNTIDTDVKNYLNNFDYKNGDVKELEKYLLVSKSNYFILNKSIENQNKIIYSNKYILYSFDKFDNLYSQRDWWMMANFYGAKLDKFDKVYPRVYDRKGVIIWKIIE